MLHISDLSKMAWLMVPDLIFSDIMMKVGFDSLDRLHSCRRVCKAWNEMILRDVCQSRKNRKIMRERIEKIWGPGMLPTNEEISEAKWAGEGCFMLKFLVNTFF